MSVRLDVTILPMDYYHLWFDLADGASDIEFVKAMTAYLDFLKNSGSAEGYSITRRKYGFSPEGLGEFFVTVHFKDMRQMQDAFEEVAPRSGEIEELHRAVFRRVKGVKTALYRDYPDPVRQQ